MAVGASHKQTFKMKVAHVELKEVANLSIETRLTDHSASPTRTMRRCNLRLWQKILLATLGVLMLVFSLTLTLVAVRRKDGDDSSVSGRASVAPPTRAPTKTLRPVATTSSPTITFVNVSSNSTNYVSSRPTSLPTHARNHSMVPSMTTTYAPTYGEGPSNDSIPSSAPTRIKPTANATSAQPSAMDIMGNDENSTLRAQSTTFYVVGDAPYTNNQAVALKDQMKNLPSDAEFFVHVGDLRDARDNAACTRMDYENVGDILRLSPVPVFVLLGDNDWNDCPNSNQALDFWQDEFLGFESRHWDHGLKVIYQPGRPENFAFAHKGSLFIGLNIVGGEVLSDSEWRTRLTDQVDWTKELIRYYSEQIESVGRIVLFGHADPGSKHRRFFNPLVEFIERELENKVPVLYINGDQHEWLYESSFFGQSSFLRIMVSGLAQDPPLRVEVHANGESVSSSNAFIYDRRLTENEE